jgi:hypothetical protein
MTKCELIKQYYFLDEKVAERPFMPKQDFTDRITRVREILYGEKNI